MLDPHIVRIGLALADPTRLRLVRVLEAEPGLTVGALVKRLGVARGTVHHHLAMLRAASMLLTDRVGSRRHVRLAPGPWEIVLRRPG